LLSLYLIMFMPMGIAAGTVSNIRWYMIRNELVLMALFLLLKQYRPILGPSQLDL